MGRKKSVNGFKRSTPPGFVPGDGMIVTTAQKGHHEIKVIVNNTTVKTATFLVDNNFYIGINYDRQAEEIAFVSADHPLMYD